MVCPTRPTRRKPCPSPFLAFVGGVFLVLAGAVPARGQWRLEAWLGQAWSASSPVTFSQDNQPAIYVTGKWSTRPFAPTWYYAGRIAKWTGNAAWAFEYMHHKIYLDNPPAGVQFFQVTNGVNFFLGERLWRRRGWEFGVGAGPLYAVPVSSVRGLIYNNAHGIFNSQYELAGAGVQANLGRRLRLLPFTFGSLSLKATAGYLHMHIASGHAVTSSFALHAEYGLSLQSKPK